MFINILTEIAPSEKFLVLGSCQVLVAAKSFLKLYLYAGFSAPTTYLYVVGAFVILPLFVVELSLNCHFSHGFYRFCAFFLIFSYIYVTMRLQS